MRPALTLAAALCVALPSAAQDAGAPATPRAPRAAADAGAASPKAPATKAVFVLAAEPATLEKYAAASPPERAGLPLLRTVKIGTRVGLGVFLEGYTLPRSRLVDLTADVLVEDCTGRTVLDRASAAAARTIDPKLHKSAPLRPWIELQFGLTDPECEYRVTLTVWDQVRGESYRAQGGFTVAR